MEIDPKDKNYVYAITYNNGVDVIIAYTAEWCKSCVKIKESFSDIFKDFKIIKEEYIQKEIFKKNINDLIPFFKKNDKEGIQTSNVEELTKYISLS